MICEFDDGNGWCTTRFKGFGCIKDRCDFYTLKRSNDMICSGIEGKGTYCHLYKRFYCAGNENCTDSSKYIRKLELSMSEEGMENEVKHRKMEV